MVEIIGHVQAYVCGLTADHETNQYATNSIRCRREQMNPSPNELFCGNFAASQISGNAWNTSVHVLLTGSSL